jgi:hypothetical protein
VRATLDDLLRRPDIWSSDDLSNAGLKTIPTGFAALNEQLPGGGWPLGALTEILSENEGIGELRLVLSALVDMSRDGRWVVWVMPPYIPYAPALFEQGMALSKILWLEPASEEQALWATEQALREPACGAVLLWSSTSKTHSLRRLQLAAEQGQTWGLVFRHESLVRHSSPATLRLHLRASPGGLVVRVLKCRGPLPGRPVLLGLEGSESA